MNNIFKYQEDGFFEEEIILSRNHELEISVDEKKHINLFLTYSGMNSNITMQISVKEQGSLNLFINDLTCGTIKQEQVIYVGKNAKIVYSFNSLDENAYEIKSDVFLTGENAVAIINSASLVKTLKKAYMTCHHDFPSTRSIMNHYAIVHENGNFEMEACGSIKKGSIKSESHQTTKVLTLSEHVKSKVVPLLRIDEDDVKASHASLIGQMDEEQLYYLQSRGLNREQALGLISLGYMLPIIETLEVKEWKTKMQLEIERKVGLYV